MLSAAANSSDSGREAERWVEESSSSQGGDEDRFLLFLFGKLHARTPASSADTCRQAVPICKIKMTVFQQAVR